MPVPLMPRAARKLPVRTRALPLSKGGLLAFAAVVGLAATYVDPVAVVDDLSSAVPAQPDQPAQPGLTASEPAAPPVNSPAAHTSETVVPAN